ncbi:hypothetical protein VE01_07824 [Pseudogymnoascus verrucosus]|uniref:Uncharacterized protein n=1 Tax=Pseudogymnoascus verrucosus TaxID=342668 RepID=A0A1B8GEG7_9PEZI|nr:uncharacterized protein VE01_07824 [Pseudogymnoascus verrucosus]OBT94226.1 hypothetical protein VE01_07824 [Pseudogymnoascus verrucosus]
MSDSKSLPPDFPTDPSSPSDLPPPAYTSIYDSSPPPSDTKQSPSNPLTNLRTRIAANRASSSDPAAVLHRRLVTHMASRTEMFLADYGSTGFTAAKLSFCANGHVSPTSSEVLTGTAAEDAEKEFIEFDVLESDHFWDDQDAANGLAKGLERALEEKLGLKGMRGEGVDVSVKEEQGGWRRENVFGVWETGTGWGVVVRVRVDVGE